MLKESFYSVIPLVSDLYGVELDEDQVETWGLIAYNKIGNRDYLIKRMVAHPSCKKENEWFVLKPCDMSEIELITLPWEDAQDTSAIVEDIDIYTLPIENWIENGKVDNHPLYMRGKMVHFTEVGDKIYFLEPFDTVLILYKSFQYDSDNLPYLNLKELYAVATYCAYCYFYKRGLMTKDTLTILLALVLKKDWEKACSNARNPEYLNQNEGQEILNAMTSYDRHLYNRTLKIVR